MAVITENDLVIMDRLRRLREGRDIEYVPSSEELRQAEARKIILDHEIAEYQKRHKPRAEAITIKKLAEHLGISESECEALSPEERLRATNALMHASLGLGE